MEWHHFPWSHSYEIWHKVRISNTNKGKKPERGEIIDISQKKNIGQIGLVFNFIAI